MHTTDSPMPSSRIGICPHSSLPQSRTAWLQKSPALSSGTSCNFYSRSLPSTVHQILECKDAANTLHVDHLQPTCSADIGHSEIVASHGVNEQEGSFLLSEHNCTLMPSHAHFSHSCPGRKRALHVLCLLACRCLTRQPSTLTCPVQY